MDIASALSLALPELILAIGALVLLVGGAFAGEKAGRPVAALAAVVLISAAVAAIVGPLGVAFRGGFVADQMSAYAKAAIYLASGVAILLSEPWLRRVGNAKFEYSVLIMLAAIGYYLLLRHRRGGSWAMTGPLTEDEG